MIPNKRNTRHNKTNENPRPSPKLPTQVISQEPNTTAQQIDPRKLYVQYLNFNKPPPNDPSKMLKQSNRPARNKVETNAMEHQHHRRHPTTISSTGCKPPACFGTGIRWGSKMQDSTFRNKDAKENQDHRADEVMNQLTPTSISQNMHKEKISYTAKPLH